MKYILFFFLSCSLVSCIEVNNSFSKIPPGIWRVVLKLDNDALPLAQETKEVEYKKSFDYAGELPFQFEVIYTNEDDFYIELINGTERIRVDDIYFGKDKSTGIDTIEIHFPVYDSYLKALYENGVMEGNWHVNYKKDYAIPFIAKHGEGHRFVDFGKKASIDVTGKWDVTFDVTNEDAYPAIGEFYQDSLSNNLRASFLTETGDYRYLDGITVEDKMYLSCFDGAHAFLFEAKMMEDGTLNGSFRSGKHYQSNWIANLSEDASITNPYYLTKVISDDKKMNFAFRNTKNELIDINDNQFDEKAKLVVIMGTWCPNCRDEMNFLLEYNAKNPNDELEIIVIGFERYRDEEKSRSVLTNYKKKMEIPFQVLHGGYYNKKEATDKFPMLDKIISYPTLIFVDRKNIIQHIHTGFAGPATSEFEDFKISFYQSIKDILE